LTRFSHVRDLIGSHDLGLAYSPSLPCPRDHHRSRERLQSETERERAAVATADSRSDRCFSLGLRSRILAGVYRLDLELPRATGVTGRRIIAHRNITSAMAPHLAVVRGLNATIVGEYASSMLARPSSSFCACRTGEWCSGSPVSWIRRRDFDHQGGATVGRGWCEEDGLAPLDGIWTVAIRADHTDSFH
jgi:hypothetical protein